MRWNTAGDAQENGGAGGNAICARYNSGHSPKYAGGGAGNKGGIGWEAPGGNINGNATSSFQGENGTFNYIHK